MAWQSAMQHFSGSASETKLCHVAWPRGQQLSAKSCRWTCMLKRFWGWTYGKKSSSRQSLSHLIPMQRSWSCHKYLQPRFSAHPVEPLERQDPFVCVSYMPDGTWVTWHFEHGTPELRGKGMYTKLAVLSFTGPSESIWELFWCSQPVLIFLFGTTASLPYSASAIMQSLCFPLAVFCFSCALKLSSSW